MEERSIDRVMLEEYAAWLRRQERAAATQEKYLRCVRAFAAWADGRSVSRELVAAWKKQLTEQHRAPSTVNAALAALNGFFRFLGWGDCRASFLRVQRRIFRDERRELTREEYGRLLAAAKKSRQERLLLMMETICATGIRVGELRYITAEAVHRGRAEISLKGKVRAILLPERLMRKLLKYAKKRRIACGEIFLGADGRGVDRRRVWAEMKRLCAMAGVEASKVFPHNLRHLFAVSYYRAYKDVVKLADLLGHSSIETTRIYLLTSGQEHRRQLERLRLIT